MASHWKIVRFGIFCLCYCLGSSSAESGTTDDFSESEIEFSHSLDWCIGDDAHPIQWIDKDSVAVNAKIAAGARPAPDRDVKGQIGHLGGFVDDRLSTLPPEAIFDNLPTIIIENECASVTEGDEKCVFDYAATPAPFQWAPVDFSDGVTVPASIRNWERDDLTVVYVPTSDSSEGAKELTRVTTSHSKLAKLHTRGNTSRENPKKQFGLKLPSSKTLIPGGAKAKKWVLSAYSSDTSYIDNKIVFDMYRKFGELQREFSDSWPEEGSIEDLSTRAFAPRIQMVNLIFQGRYAGIYYLMDKIEAREGRVWLPEASHDTEHESKQIDGIKLPQGSYLLSRDWTNFFKIVLNPDRASTIGDNEYPNEGLLIPNFQNWTDAVFEGMFALYNVSETHGQGTTVMEWKIMSPKDKTFLDSETDEDIFLLKAFLLQLHTWLEDPVENNDILSNVIDMTSMARWFLLQEIAKEIDAYVASMYFKVVGGKLYHASPWDYAGSSFFARSCKDIHVLNFLPVNRETNTYSTRAPCNETTGDMATAGWWVNSLYNTEEILCNLLSGEMGKMYGIDCSEGKSTLTDMKWFFGNIFRVPALQEEFWKLWDIVIDHKLVTEENGSDSGDLFSMDLFADKIFEPISETVDADRRIWYNPSTLQNRNASFDASIFNSDTCEPLLEESLRRSNAGSTPILDPFTIPGENWAFHTASKNGEFITFYKGLVAEEPINTLSEYVDNHYALSEKQKFFKYRLEWIMSQYPGIGNVDASQISSELPGSKPNRSMLSMVIIAVVVCVVLIVSAKWFWKDERSSYQTVSDVELE